jgi:hydroxymethylpyrimidine/phosphomethylpyrimidine kinase
LWGISPDRLVTRTPSAAILIKGGHRKDNPGTDILFINGTFYKIEGESFGGITKHGTGCVFSAAATAFLAKGSDIPTACRNAKAYTEKFILSNELNLGYHHGE